MRYVAEVLTSWQTDETGNHPAIIAFLQAGDSAEDSVGQSADAITPEPNLCVWRVHCSGDTLAAIDADADHDVLWSEEVEDE